MNESLHVPPAASFYILLQRTAYQSALLTRMLRRAPASVGLRYARLEAALRREEIASRFRRGILRDFRSMAPFLPDEARTILDVGCGLAAIDILLSRHCSAVAAPHLYLADFGETSRPIDYGFGSSHARYNSFDVAREMLLANAVPLETIHFIDPQQLRSSANLPRFELVISTLAWGFHFPVESYLEEVSARMVPEGRLILDIRVGTDGIEQLRKRFPAVHVIEESEVRQRVVASK